ncbi:hypothetical protein [Aneurinibacillus migulanus]|uniref:hypothetical protein n=4 Tax=Aneurinibacillus migulanus TaxID=47500 RepID=UPI0005B999A9|nr:hypothetical protein [Aneurinibacillus migulanus]KIV56496.1 hypothetical protein TS64_09570 [Aneurinibacillus migulanus]
MKKIATAFLAISLLATTPVFAAEQKSNQNQQQKDEMVVSQIPQSKLPKTVQASLDKVYSLLPEAKNLKLYDSKMYSSNIKGKEQPKKYTLGFNKSGKREDRKRNDKEFIIEFDETGKILHFTFEKLSLVNLEGNTREKKAQDLLKRLYGKEANEYKIKKVLEISKDNPNYKGNEDSMRGAIVFMPTSPEKEPVLILFNNKNEFTSFKVSTRDILKM